jgi:hypothetical protein
MATRRYPVVSQQGIGEILANLADYGIISRPNGSIFSVSFDTTVAELEAELVTVGSQCEPNRLKEILSMDLQL